MKKLSVLLFFIVATTACTYQKNNIINQKDAREGDVRVYGVSPDSAARQLSITYTAKPELQQKADAIKEKLYPTK